MNSLLVFSAFLTIAVGVAHSYLGERYILIRLFKRTDLPRLRGSEVFTKRILRFAWHLTSVAWWGYAALLLALAAHEAPSRQLLGALIAVTFLITATITALASRGRHLAWPLFLGIAVLAWVATRR